MGTEGLAARSRAEGGVTDMSVGEQDDKKRLVRAEKPWRAAHRTTPGVQGRGVETMGSRGEAGRHDFIRSGVNCSF